MMHEHDPDLIAAFAEGSLDADQTPQAEALIASCNDCRRELEAQRLALAAMAGAPRPQMTGAERSELHRAINREAATATGTPWYVRLAPALSAAAVLVLVVGVVGVMLRGSFGGADQAAFVPEETTAPAGAAADATAAPATTAAGDALRATDAAAAPLSVEHLGKMTTDELTTFVSENRDALRYLTSSESAPESSVGQGLEVVAIMCQAEAALLTTGAIDEAATTTYTAELEESSVEIFFFNDGATVVYETPDCNVLFDFPAP